MHSASQRSVRRLSKLWLLLGACAVAAAIPVLWHYTRPTPLERAREALANGDQTKAAEALREHLEEQPGASEARLRLADLIRDSNPDEALSLLRQIPSGDPQYLAALRETAVICLLQQRYEEAEQPLLRLEQNAPEDYGVQLSLAEVQFHLGNYESALPRALQAAQIGPGRAETQLLIAEIYDELGRPSAMIEPLENAIELDPNSYAAHINLAYASYATGRLAAAAQHADWCRQRDSQDAAAYRILASVARDEGRIDEAEAELKKALSLSPEDVDCRILEADLLLYRRMPEEAYQRLQPLYEQHKSTARYLGTLARAAGAAGRSDEARDLQSELQSVLDSQSQSL
jgi:predicted Zn-dependent protease